MFSQLTNCTILMYHIIDEPMNSIEQRLCCTLSQFRSQMQYLKEAGYAVISLSEIARCLNGEAKWPVKAIAITFDDGTSCTYENALPILQAFNFTASVFMVSNLVGKSNDWLIDAGFPCRKMLTWDELLALDSHGIEIGSHTQSHCKLGEVDAARAMLEIKQSKLQLEQRLGKQVRYFAYPYGSLNQRVRNGVMEAGYQLACSTRAGKNRPDVDPYLLRRVEVCGQDSLWQFRMKLWLATKDMPPYSLVKNIGRRILGKIAMSKNNPVCAAYQVRESYVRR